VLDADPDTTWAVGEGHSRDHTAVLHFGRPLTTWADSELVFRIRHESRFPRTTVGKFTVALATLDEPAAARAMVPEAVLKSLRLAPADRKDEDTARIRRHYRGVCPELREERRALARLEAERSLLLGRIPATLVSRARTEPRVMRLLPRGNWMDDSGPVMEPAVPERFGRVAPGRRATRLDLADWIAAPSNPLTARVFVNRLWKQFFGSGLSRVLDDVGSQGEWPTHPELLDWLAAEFMQPSTGGSSRAAPPHAWDVKHVVRLIVTSAAYRQSSRVPPALLEKDPYNRLLARQSRFRLDAEFIRDHALAVSGLLVEQVGGPSVRPPQPEGYWAALNFPKREYVPGVGAELYRRSLYTHWQRTFVHPALAAFDAPSREECTANRPNSNTPLQALVLLNDPAHAEAARALAAAAIHAAGPRPADAIVRAGRRVLGRPPRPEELSELTALHAEQRARYAADPAAARALLSIGPAPSARDIPEADLAAMTSVARALLNLHECVTRN
jgi:hypothetical protein